MLRACFLLLLVFFIISLFFYYYYRNVEDHLERESDKADLKKKLHNTENRYVCGSVIFLIFILYQSIVDLQCCVSFRCTAK